ncbi:MAG: NAD(P)/FAD-dependent oxidoreductase, partial [Gemmataceae bacterium]
RDVAAFDAGGLHDPESNYLFGEGGAGTFSDGKLTYRGSGPDVRYVLELFAACKGKPSIVYEARPHLGSNRLPAVVKAMRQRIEAHGGEVRFDCRVEDLDLAGGAVRGVMTSSGYVPAGVVLLAIGHSARDTYEMLARRGVPMEQKPFQFGVRIEQPQEAVNRVCYGDARLEQKLGAASYSLVANGPHDLFTFCMCAGGYVMPSVSDGGAFCTNGMSLSKHDSPYANSGLVVTIDPAHFGGTDALAGVRLQQSYERIAFEVGGREYRCPAQSAADYLAGRVSAAAPKTSYPRETVSADLRQVLPPLVAEAVAHGLPIMDRRWGGRFLKDAALVGPEARGSAPVRIVRDAARMSPGVAGLYPVGEGA